jgi:hypothetical protein
VPTCARCAADFPSWVYVDGTRRNVSSRRICLACVPFGSAPTGPRREGRRHPDLREDFFDLIDSLEKAYWLGFLSADGYVLPSLGRVTCALSLKDEEHLLRFAAAIGADPTARKLRIHPSGARSVSLTLCSTRLGRALASQGCGPKKSHTLRFPAQLTGDCRLAWLLGYFDGDGTAGSTDVCSASLELLRDIQSLFVLSAPIRRAKTVWRMCLGVDLFRQMLTVYPESMLRKRAPCANHKSLTSEQLAAWHAKPNESSHRGVQFPARQRFRVSDEELARLVWAHPLRDVAALVGVSDVAVKKRCVARGIATPPRGFWLRVSASPPTTGPGSSVG